MHFFFNLFAVSKNCSEFVTFVQASAETMHYFIIYLSFFFVMISVKSIINFRIMVHF